MIQPPFKINNLGIKMLQDYEKCHKKNPTTGLIHPYLDDVGVWTIGWGTTYFPDGTRVSASTSPITRAQADELFRTMLHKFEDSVNFVVTTNINENKFSACCVLAYNIGREGFASSTALKRINANMSEASIREAWGWWVDGRVDGKLVQLPGLVRRRKEELDLFFTPV